MIGGRVYVVLWVTFFVLEVCLSSVVVNWREVRAEPEVRFAVVVLCTLAIAAAMLAGVMWVVVAAWAWALP